MSKVGSTNNVKFNHKYQVVLMHYGDEDISSPLPTKSIAELLGMGKFDLYPKTQRRSEAWSDSKRVKFIEAIMDGALHLGTIIIRYYSKRDYYSMIDGSHRMSTIWLLFFDDKIKCRGKLWSDFKDFERKQFLKNAQFHTVVYTDITDGQSALIFQEANDGRSLNEAELYNSLAGELSDIVRIMTRSEDDRQDSKVPSYYEKLDQHPLFIHLGHKWRNRHEHEMVALQFILEAYFNKARKVKLNIYDKGTANEKSARQRMYFRWVKNKKTGQFEIDDGYWDEVVNNNPNLAKQILNRASTNMKTMYNLMSAAPKATSLGKSDKPGKLFWNLFYFWLGLQLDFPNVKIKDYDKFVGQYIKLDTILAPHSGKKKKGKPTEYERLSGQWQPGDHQNRNAEMMKQFRKQGNFDTWGIYGATPRNITPKEKEVQYINQDGICPIEKRRFPLNQMEAHHSVTSYYNNGSNALDNIMLISTIAHRGLEHAA